MLNKLSFLIKHKMQLFYLMKIHADLLINLLVLAQSIEDLGL